MGRYRDKLNARKRTSDAANNVVILERFIENTLFLKDSSGKATGNLNHSKSGEPAGVSLRTHVHWVGG